MKTSVENLVAIVSALTGSHIVTVEAVTEPKLLKRGNPFHGNVLKVARVNGMVGTTYENHVNNQRARECESVDTLEHFEAADRAWGHHEAPAVIEKKGVKYLQLIVNKSLGYEYFDKITGEKLDKEEVNKFLPKKSSSRQDVAKEVIYRNYKFSNIKSLKLQGELLEVE